MATRYEVITQKSKTTDKVVDVPIPPELLKKIGWKEGDRIEITVDSNGKYLFKRTDK